MTRRFQLLGSELSGKAGREVLEVLVSKPKGSPDLTVPLPWNSQRGPHSPSAHPKNLPRALRPLPIQQEAGVSTTIRYMVGT